MSLWKYGACVQGFNAAHASPADAAMPPPPSRERFLELKRRYADG